MSSHPATIVGAAPCEDVAVLKASGISELKPLVIAPQSQLQEGDNVVALGFPANASLDDNLIATQGIVSVPRTEFSASGSADVANLTDAIQTTAAINPGNSGGPLVNYQGQLVGIDGAVSPAPTASSSRDRATRSARTASTRSCSASHRALDRLGRLRLHLPDLDPAVAAGGQGISARSHRHLHRAGQPGVELAAFQMGPALITAIDGHAIDGALTTYCSAVKRTGKSLSVNVSLLNSGQSGTVQVPFQ